MTRRRLSAVILATLIVTSIAGVVPASAQEVQANDEIFTEAALEEMGLTGWNPDKGDIVRYGADRNPGWYVYYEDGHETDLESWAQGSPDREIRSRDADGNVMLISAPPEHVGAESSLLSDETQLRYLDYVTAIGVNRHVEINPIRSSELRDKSAWGRPAGGWAATYAGLRGGWSADAAAWGSEVNTSTLDSVRADLRADEVTVNGSGIRFAVIDTGLDYDDALYGARVPMAKNTLTNTTVTISDPQNATESDYEAVADGSSSNHGSWVATAIAGNGTVQNATGIAPAGTLIPVKGLDDDGTGTTESIASGLEYACEAGNADVVSMSLGSPISSKRINGEIRECLQDEDVSAVVVAAGNSRLTYRYLASPGDAPSVVTVAATDAKAVNKSESAYFSQVGPDPDTDKQPSVAAPGMEITAETAEGNVTLSGTSMSTPLVSGSIGLMLEARPSLQGQPVEVRQSVEEHAEPMPEAASTEVGAGRVSAYNMVNDVQPDQSQTEAQNQEADARDGGNEALAGSFWRRLLN